MPPIKPSEVNKKAEKSKHIPDLRAHRNADNGDSRGRTGRTFFSFPDEV